MSGTGSMTGTGSPVSQVPAGTYTVQADTAFAGGLGVNVASVTPTLTGTELTALGLDLVRTTVTTQAEASALETLAAGGIRFDLVLAPGQTVAQFMGYADAINATTLTTAGAQGTASHAVVAVEGPDLTTPASVASYTYTVVGNTVDTFGAATSTPTGLSGADYATVELYQAATDRSTSNPSQTGTSASGTTSAEYSAANSATAIAGVVVLPYSTTGTVPADSTVGSYVGALNVNLGAAPVGEPDNAALVAAAQTAAQIGAGYDGGGTPATEVSQAGAATAGGLLDLLLDSATPQVATTTAGTTTTTATYAAASTTYLSSLAAASATGTSTTGTSTTGTSTGGTSTGTTTSTAATAVSLFDANGTLTAAGTALHNLEAILVAPTGFSSTGTSTTGTSTTGTSTGGTSTGTTTSTGGTAATLALTVGTYTAGTQVATNVAVFAAPDSGDNIVWWDNVDSANGTTGHGGATLGFSEVESSVRVFDPTKGASAISTYTNISSLAVTNFGDGPLVVQISDILGSSTGTASAVGTYAGVSATATSTVTGGSGGGTTTTTGGSGGGTTTVTGGSGGGTTTAAGGSGGVTTSMGASGGITYTSVAGTSTTISATGTGTVLVNSLGSDTVQAGGGTDVVYASGPAGSVSGGAGTLIFVAGTGSYTAGGGTGNDILYGNSGPAVLTGGGTGHSVLVAGTGNATLLGGAGPGAVMFGGTAANSFTGSAAGNDTLVGGSGANTFTMTSNDVAFGGANGGDTFNTGTGAALVVEGPGAERVNFGGGPATVFGGTGTDTYGVTRGLGGTDDIVGFKSGDSLNLAGGFTTVDSANALSTATTGSFGTVLHLSDGTTINVFGATVAASQITVT